MREFLRSRTFKVLALLGVVGFAVGVWLLLHPAAFWLQPWRPAPSTVGSRFIFGPYPVEPDFEHLKQERVTTIVSLLDPMLPYEKVLLDQERERAGRFGMRVLNFPMASILGQSFGKDYLANSKAAAQAALDSEGVVYLHCYLGLHRAANVRKFLQEKAETSLYGGTRKSGRSADTLALDQANLAYIDGKMEAALAELDRIQQKTPEANVLEGWVNYRLNRLDAARAAFQRVLDQVPGHSDATSGLGFCALRANDLATAEKQFSAVLAANPDDSSGLEGLGHTRLREGRTAEARALFERLLSRHPENTEVQELLHKLKETP